MIDYNDNFLLENEVESDEEDVKKEMDELRQIIYEHFQVTSLNDILPFFYSDFKKNFIASLTAKLAPCKSLCFNFYFTYKLNKIKFKWDLNELQSDAFLKMLVTSWQDTLSQFNQKLTK